MLNNTTATIKSNTTAGEGFSIKKESAGKIIGMLINMYSSPVTPIRELVMNGIEAHQIKKQETGENPGPVVVEIQDEAPASLLSNSEASEDSTSTVTITDYGVGMSEQEFRNIFLNIAMSSKDTSDEFVGGFGIGSKSVFMLSPTVDFTTTKNGKTTRAIISLTGNGTDSVITTTETGADSGTIVRFTIDHDKREAIVRQIGQEFTDYAEPDTVRLIVNGVELVTSENYKSLVPGMAVFGSYENPGDDENMQVTVIAKGEIPYHYTVENVAKYLDNTMVETIASYGRIFSAFYTTERLNDASRCLVGLENKVIRLDLSRDDITPSREALISSTSLNDRIVHALIDSMHQEITTVTNTIATVSSSREFVEMLRSDEVISKFADTIVSQIVSVAKHRGHVNTENASRLFAVNSPQIAMCEKQSLNQNAYCYSDTVQRPFNSVFYNFEKSVKLNSYVTKYGRNCDLINRIGVVMFRTHNNDTVSMERLENILALIPDFALEATDYKEHKENGTSISYLGLLDALFDVEIVNTQELRAQAMKVGGKIYKEEDGAQRKGSKKNQGIKFSMAYRGEDDTFTVRHYANVTDIANDLETGGELDHLTTLYGANVYKEEPKNKIWEAENGVDLLNALLYAYEEDFQLTEAEFDDVAQVFSEHDAIIIATCGAEFGNIEKSMNRRNNGRALSYNRIGGHGYTEFVAVEARSFGVTRKLVDLDREEVIKAIKVQLFLNTRSDLDTIAFNVSSYSYNREAIRDMAQRIIRKHNYNVAGWQRIREAFSDLDFFNEMFEAPSVKGELGELANYLQGVYGDMQEEEKTDVKVYNFIAERFYQYVSIVDDIIRGAYGSLSTE